MFIRPISVFFILAIAVLTGGVVYLHSELGNLRESHTILKDKYDKLSINSNTQNSTKNSEDTNFTLKDPDTDAFALQKKKLDRLEEEYRKSIENLKSAKAYAEDPGGKVANLENRIKGLETGVINVEGYTREQLKEEMKKINDEIQKEERERSMKRLTDRILEDLTAKLDLRSEQKAKIGKILEDGMMKIQQVFTSMRSGTVSREDIRKEMETVRNETDQQVYGVLTAEQRTKYDEYKKENPMFSGRYGGDGGGRREGGSSGGQRNQ